MSPSNYVIVTDLDGTLLNDKTKVPQSNLDAIKKFTSAGGYFTLASGRYGNKVGELFPDFEKYINAPAVLCNGAYLCDFQKNEIVFENPTPTDKYMPIINGILSGFPDLDDMVIVVKRNGVFTPINPKDLHDDYIYKVVAYAPSDYLLKVREYAEKNFSDIWYFSKSSKTLFEILNPNATKGKTIIKLKELYAKMGMDVKIIAVGDYENDYDMLCCADIAACPSNAIDKVKEVCDIHLCDNNTGCIADLIDRILSNKPEVRK